MLDRVAEVDRAALEAAASMRSTWLSTAFVVISAWWLKGLVITGLGGLADLRSRRPPWTMVSAGVAAGLAAAITAGLKEAFDRSRPSVADPSFASVVAPPGSDSLPSGHAAEAFAAATVIAILAPRLRLPALVLAALVAVSRVYLGVHYPLDVLAGTLVGVLTGLAVGLLCKRRLRSARPVLAQKTQTSSSTMRTMRAMVPIPTYMLPAFHPERLAKQVAAYQTRSEFAAAAMRPSAASRSATTGSASSRPTSSKRRRVGTPTGTTTHMGRSAAPRRSAIRESMARPELSR